MTSLDKSKGKLSYLIKKAKKEPELIIPFLKLKLKRFFLVLPFVDLPLYAYSLKKFSENPPLNTKENAFEFAKEFEGLGTYRKISPQQSKKSILEVVNKVRNKQPEIIMEIGTSLGGTLFLWSQCFESVEKIISLDTYFGPKKKFFRNFNKKIDFDFIEGNSHSKRTKTFIKNMYEGGEIDFLYIDADHSYKGVKEDFQFYKKYVKDGGLMGLHDINNKDTGVPKFWKEIKKEYKTKEVGKGKGKNGLVYFNG